MLKRMCVVCACLLVASTAGAATLVTWQVNGTVQNRIDLLVRPEPGTPMAPPIGTPLSATLTFDPSTAFPTFSAMPGGTPGCNTVRVSGSVTIGSYSAVIGSGSEGHTRALTPVNPCGPTESTEFVLFLPPAPPGAEFALPFGALFISYRDLLVRDAFPNSPTSEGLAHFDYFEIVGGLTHVFGGQAALSAVDQSTPVPEPGTMTLVGLGLLAAARKRRTIFSRP